MAVTGLRLAHVLGQVVHDSVRGVRQLVFRDCLKSSGVKRRRALRSVPVTTATLIG